MELYGIHKSDRIALFFKKIMCFYKENLIYYLFIYLFYSAHESFHLEQLMKMASDDGRKVHKLERERKKMRRNKKL